MKSIQTSIQLISDTAVDINKILITLQLLGYRAMDISANGGEFEIGELYRDIYNDPQGRLNAELYLKRDYSLSNLPLVNYF